MTPQKRPLYRKDNTTAHRAWHSGGDDRDERHTRAQRADDRARTPMHGRHRRGLDYTPLFKFLLARCGQPWDGVYSEAVARLDKPEPIFWLVALPGHARQRYVRMGESSYYSGLYVDEAGLLQRVDPALGPGSFWPCCKCCTHTFNGVAFTRPFAGFDQPFEAEG